MSEKKIEKIPKADLHVHLNGAIPITIVKDLIQLYNCELPEGFDCDKDLQILNPVASLHDYFRPWYALKQLPRGQKCLYEMVYNAAVTLYQDSVVYAELRNSPFYIAKINNISLQETIEWLCEAVSLTEESTGVQLRLVLSMSRYNFTMSMGYELLKAIKHGDKMGFVGGFDLSGDENSTIPDDAYVLFRKAKDEYGLGITIHAGETGNEENIRWAIQKCKADRIGHGLAAINSSTTTNMLIENDICLEVCLTSNLRTGQISNLNEHPVVKFVNTEIPFVLCSDNPAVHGTTLSDDYRSFVEVTGRHDILNLMYDRQNHYSFRR